MKWTDRGSSMQRGKEKERLRAKVIVYSSFPFAVKPMSVYVYVQCIVAPICIKRRLSFIWMQTLHYKNVNPASCGKSFKILLELCVCKYYCTRVFSLYKVPEYFIPFNLCWCSSFSDFVQVSSKRGEGEKERNN